MSEKYTYLFPYEKVPQGSHIIIYGAGDVGQEYLQQMQLTGYCEIVAFVDKAYDKYSPMIVPIYPVDKVRTLSFDYVVLAFKMGAHIRAVTKLLLELGVSNNQIIYVAPRNEIKILISDIDTSEVSGENYAYKHDGVSIALKYGPGIGDTLVKKKIFMEIVSMEPNCHIDIYCPGISQVVHSFYGDQKNLNTVFDDGGALYASHHSKYDLSLTLSFMMEVDNFNYERVKEHNIEFAEKLKQLQEACSNYHLTGVGVIQRYVHFHRMKFLGLDYYTYPNYTGVFTIKDHQVKIPLDESYEYRVHQLALPEKYVTINYGGGVVSNSTNNEIAKEWPFPYLEEFVKLFKEKYPQVGVIQLGSIGTPKVTGVDACFLGENLELVKYILRDSLIHIDKEGGLVHLATQLGTKCIVCFGPTQEEFFGYPENINLKAGNCHGCHCLYDGFDVCARGMEKPECMWSITPEMVMEQVETLKNCD